MLELHISGITGDFSLKHFVNIHKKLFGDVYFFAGEFRKENIAKGSFRFADYRYINDEIVKIFEKIYIKVVDFFKKVCYYNDVNRK